ncbi:response regulator [Ciceribacter sp. L1K23]|uniref:response regulator n=1 Tax=Ciceribacter sp. L1K23 TaxID=2820276 RepID=UPI001B810F08|nr:response regulator [Ciceribacter sp. L1K23]MBR0556628.1 response regulator [Ciceribacter sp. L1K23]
MTITDDLHHCDTILVVEDNVLLALDAAASVTAAGCDVVMTARSGEALALLASRSFRGAILDFNVQDGTVAGIVKRLTEAAIPFRVVSAMTPAIIEQAGIPRDVIRSKPIDYDNVVDDILSARAA